MKNERLRFSRHWILAATIAVATAVAPVAAAAATWLDLGSTGSTSEFPAKPLHSKNAGWIEVSAYSFGGGKSAVVPRGGGKTAGARSTESMSVTIAPNPTVSQTLFDDAARGTALRVVRLYMMKPSAKGMIPYYVVTLRNVLIGSDQWSGKGSDQPTESVTFIYEQIEIQYNDGDKTAADAKSAITWSVVQNRPSI